MNVGAFVFKHIVDDFVTYSPTKSRIMLGICKIQTVVPNQTVRYALLTHPTDTEFG
jgi:hypothetical protein